MPRKTFWPPTISTNSSTTFSKHESSTSLSCKFFPRARKSSQLTFGFLDSDDNSSIQSSPWQRDHCWKQTQPRHNISKEMILFYHRPDRLRLSPESQKIAQSKRRRPLDKNGHFQFIKQEKKEDSDSSGSDESKFKSDDEKMNGDEDSKSKDTIDSPEADKPESKGTGKLDKILKKLADRMTSTLAINGNGSSNGHHGSQQPPTTYSLATHIASTINTQHHQHVSPRKRILRELEKVSLEDSKRSRPKIHASNGTAIPTSSISPQLTNGSLKNQHEKVAIVPPVSRPISSYSITSLLAHNNNSSASSASGCNSINEHSNDSSSASHYHRDGTQQQRLSLSQQHSPPKSPSMMQQKRKSPNTTPPGNGNGHNYHSPNHSPSPEHHAFHKYRPTTSTAASPYGNSYSSPSYLRGSPSPHGDSFNNNRLRTSYQHSPSHYDSSPSQSFAAPRDSSLSPNVERSNASSRSTPTSSGASVIRTVPKKTAALRQQFSSPTMESSSKKPLAKVEKNVEMESLLRPALIHPPVPHLAAQMYPYMYPTMGYLPAGVPPYYHPTFYNPMMAAGYRIPGFPPGAIPPGFHGAAMSPITAAQMAATAQMSPYDKNGHRNSMISSPPANHSSLSPYVQTSPWNPIPLTNHSINDGNLIAKAKDEPSSGENPRRQA